jgi:hypothetical protein
LLEQAIALASMPVGANPKLHGQTYYFALTLALGIHGKWL